MAHAPHGMPLYVVGCPWMLLDAVGCRWMLLHVVGCCCMSLDATPHHAGQQGCPPCWCNTILMCCHPSTLCCIVVHDSTVEVLWVAMAVAVANGSVVMGVHIVAVLWEPYHHNGQFNNIQRHPTASNSIQRHPTASNDTQQHLMTSNDTQQHPMTPNDAQRRPTTPNDAQ